MNILLPKRNKVLSAGQRLVVLMIAGFLATSPALAAKPDSPGQGRGQGQGQGNEAGHGQGSQGQSGQSHGKDSSRGGPGGGANVSHHFGDHERSVIRDYYRREFGRGSCPPGLAKKHNGCMPPGLAKQWRRGYPLPHDVIYYDLPYALARELGRAPEGHKYVRVAADILLIAVGTGMVVDAIEDLNNL
jgi:hypothetical protein